MRRLFALTILLLMSVSVFAQEHLTFKGIPIDGSASEFITKLTQCGYKKTADEGLLTGTFVGMKCKIYVESSCISHTVHTVSVVLEPQSDWASIKHDYALIKEGLTMKYGSYVSCKEEFRSPHKEGDGYATLAFHDGCAEWHSEFKANGGDITLFVRDQEHNKMAVIVRYTDTINSKLQVQELTQDL